MNRDKQIEEIAQDLCPLYGEYKSCKTCDAVLDIGEEPCVYKCMAELITTKEYRKQSENMVEVVRCKDCKHCTLTEDGEYNPEDIVCGYFMTDGMQAYDYCSYGERKE